MKIHIEKNALRAMGIAECYFPNSKQSTLCSVVMRSDLVVDGSIYGESTVGGDDITENITHIIRGEDHISNTAYHIQIFKALGSTIPDFAHHPFLTDNKGRGFGKRIGSLSIESLKEEGYENITLLNYLLNIGSSNDVIAEKDIEALVSNFNLKNISSSSPKFSKEVLKFLNKDILQSYKSNEISLRLVDLNNNLPEDKLWQFVKNNISFFLEIKNWIDVINSENNVFGKNIDKNFLDIAIETLPKEPFNEETWDTWTNLIKNKTGLKGKELFMPLRIALTGMNKGPELKYLLPLLNKKIILKKFGKI